MSRQYSTLLPCDEWPVLWLHLCLLVHRGSKEILPSQSRSNTQEPTTHCAIAPFEHFLCVRPRSRRMHQLSPSSSVWQPLVWPSLTGVVSWAHCYCSHMRPCSSSYTSSSYTNQQLQLAAADHVCCHACRFDQVSQRERTLSLTMRETWVRSTRQGQWHMCSRHSLIPGSLAVDQTCCTLPRSH